MDLSSSPSNNNLTLQDISTIYKEDFIDLTSVSQKFKKKHTCISISDNIILIGKIHDFDIWMDSKTNILLIAFPNSPIKSWYKIKRIEELNKFINYFTDVQNYNETVNIFINYFECKARNC